MKRLSLTLMTLAALTTALATTRVAAASTPPRSATIQIRHQVHGCHAWSVNGGPYRATQSVTLRRGGSIRIVNDDVMPHHLLRVSGPGVRMHNGSSMPMHMGSYDDDHPGHMDHMGATTTIGFPKAGVYRFKTVAGEDYMSGIHTIGSDNQLRLTVIVK